MDKDSAPILNLDQLQFSMDALIAVGEIDGFNGAWPVLSRMTQEQLDAMVARARVESTDSASRLEGLQTGTTEMADGYAAALAQALAAPAAITDDWIISLHRALLGDESDAGVLKTEPNSVVAFDAEGKSLGAIFTTEKPEDTPRRLAELATWIDGALTETTLHPAVAIAVFTALFLEIHPFRAGTIRLASVLTTALLVRAGYLVAPYGSLDRAIEKSKYSYYLSLRRTLGSLRTGQPEWKHWLDFFLRALLQQKREIEERIAEDRAVGDDLPELSAQILAIVRETGRVTIAAAANATATSRNTIKDHVGRLVEQGHLTLHGAGRGAWYGLR